MDQSKYQIEIVWVIWESCYLSKLALLYQVILYWTLISLELDHILAVLAIHLFFFINFCFDQLNYWYIVVMENTIMSFTLIDHAYTVYQVISTCIHFLLYSQEYKSREKCIHVNLTQFLANQVDWDSYYDFVKY